MTHRPATRLRNETFRNLVTNLATTNPLDFMRYLLVSASQLSSQYITMTSTIRQYFVIAWDCKENNIESNSLNASVSAKPNRKFTQCAEEYSAQTMRIPITRLQFGYTIVRELQQSCIWQALWSVKRTRQSESGIATVPYLGQQEFDRLTRSAKLPFNYICKSKIDTFTKAYIKRLSSISITPFTSETNIKY